MRRIFYSLLSIYRRARNASRLMLFSLGGKRPWSKGYFEYKWRSISYAINDAQIMDCFAQGKTLPQGYGIGIDERIIEFPWALSQLPSRPAKMLDAGSALNFLELVHHAKVSNKDLTIITLAPETNNFSKLGISYVYGDLRKLPFQDHSFDLITCISTLEHVGLDNTGIYTKEEQYRQNNTGDYIAALKELHRVLVPGGKLLLTVPFGMYANIGFMQQFTPEMIDAILAACPWKASSVVYYQYSGDGWNISTRQAAQSATYFNIHATKTIEADRAAAARAVACITLTS